jgi:hypothetical protein
LGRGRLLRSSNRWKRRDLRTPRALPAHDRVEEFAVQKTFAWGGIYGASTTMEDIEQSFAEGIANALTGQDDDKRGAGNYGKSASAK